MPRRPSEIMLKPTIRVGRLGVTEEFRLERSEGRAVGRDDRKYGWEVGPKARAASSLALGTGTLLFLGMVTLLLPVLLGLDLAVWLMGLLCGLAATPAVGLVARGVDELVGSEQRPEPRSVEYTRRRSGKHTEQQLLEVIERHGEATPARIAMETSLTVAEADDKLRELAQGGHVEVRAHDGRLFYSL